MTHGSKALRLIAEVARNKQPKVYETLSGWAEEYLYENLHPAVRQSEKKVRDLNNIEEVRNLYESKKK